MQKYHVKIGHNTVVCKNVLFRVGGNIIIGDNCVINERTLLDGRGGVIRIGDHVDIAQESIIWTMGHNTHTHQAVLGNVEIGDYCWIGCRVQIMPGLTIGKSSICAAGAIITKNVEPNSIYGGVPARRLSSRDRTIDYTLTFNSKYR